MVRVALDAKVGEVTFHTMDFQGRPPAPRDADASITMSSHTVTVDGEESETTGTGGFSGVEMLVDEAAAKPHNKLDGHCALTKFEFRVTTSPVDAPCADDIE